jgi:hypothetical protein
MSPALLLPRLDIHPSSKLVGSICFIGTRKVRWKNSVRGDRRTSQARTLPMPGVELPASFRAAGRGAVRAGA